MTTAKLDIPNLRQELESLISQIPRGRATTFGDLARSMGDVGAARWVAQTVRGGELPEDCPTHRVVLKSGELGGGNSPLHQQLLEDEGVPVADFQVDLNTRGFQDFSSNRPLALLKDHQARLPERIELSPYSETPGEIAAVDLSYLGNGTAVACYALVETTTGQLVWSATVHRPVSFPYISGYLAYRELPILLDLIEHVRSQRALAEVVFVDGNGYLHPRRAGIASHLGVLANLRTAGVGKKLLCGKTDLFLVEPANPQPILEGDEAIGMAVKAEAGSRPVFVSPGHRMDVGGAARLAMLLFHGHRLPEPIYHADAISRREAKRLMDASGSTADPLSPLSQNL